MKKVSYALGLGIGQQLKSMGAQDLCIDDFAQAIKDVLENKELAVSHHEAQSIVTQYFQEKEAAMNKEKEAKGKQAKADGEKFLKENAQKEGVVTTASGLQYMVLQEGNGKSPKATDKDALRQQPATRRTSRFPAQRGNRRMDRRAPTDERRCKIPFLYPLLVRLRCRRRRKFHPALQHIDFRCGTHQSTLKII